MWNAYGFPGIYKCWIFHIKLLLHWRVISPLSFLPGFGIPSGGVAFCSAPSLVLQQLPHCGWLCHHFAYVNCPTCPMTSFFWGTQSPSSLDFRSSFGAHSGEFAMEVIWSHGPIEIDDTMLTVVRIHDLPFFFQLWLSATEGHITIAIPGWGSCEKHQNGGEPILGLRNNNSNEI